VSDLPALPDVPAAPTAVDARGRAYELTPRAVLVRTLQGATRRVHLDDPGDTAFAALPRIDLSDGRPLRRAAFEQWSAQLRAQLAGGATWETTYRPRKPYHTGFGMLGGVVVGGSCLAAVLTWASSDPQVRREPGLVDGVVLLAGVGVLLWIALAALSSAVRLWLTRRGSFVRVTARGVTVGREHGPRAPSGIAWATHHPFLRATALRLRDGGTVWVPRDEGPLRRLDLVLAALPGGPEPAI
jgi:hypothetical protein